MHEADGLPRKQDLQKMNAFAERDTRQSSAESNQGGPENNAREILVAEQDQSQSRQQGQRQASELSHLGMHYRPAPQC